MADITRSPGSGRIFILPAALEAGARAMAKAGYAFSGIELTDPYTADADYWDCCARAALGEERT